jgi:hypothetical protein
VDIELEDLNDFRFYKLKIQWRRKCTCGGLLKMFRHNSTITEHCFKTDCGKDYPITRICSYCDRKHDFEDGTCDKCENKVINLTTMSVTIEECSKAIKKINRQYKQGLLNESDWKSALHINQEEKDKCLKSLEKLKSEIGIYP